MSRKGIIALMGSGELTATMVEVHKELLGRLAAPPRAAFLDTPAGFQLNADQLSQKAIEYFRDRVLQPMAVASFKGKEGITPYEAEQAFQTLKEANYVLIGPGSPTYAVRTWRETLIPEILARMVEKGGCLVAASAAALTVGCATLPVYEIYKVGEDLHWVDGINVLAHFGFNLAVIPHWNNAEGGTHDTRFCYMGETRFERLQSLLSEDVAVLGLDEHTACLIDFEAQEAVVKGVGRVTLRRHGAEISFAKGERFSLDLLRDGGNHREWGVSSPQPAPAALPEGSREESFWDRIHALEAAFQGGLEGHEPRAMTSALLELDRIVWEAHQDLESTEFISQAREILREMIVLLGVELAAAPQDKTSCLNPLVTEMIELRKRFRQEKKWPEADAVRESLQRAKIIVEDTKDGSLWRLGS
jgi:peptidase E